MNGPVGDEYQDEVDVNAVAYCNVGTAVHLDAGDTERFLSPSEARDLARDLLDAADTVNDLTDSGEVKT